MRKFCAVKFQTMNERWLFYSKYYAKKFIVHKDRLFFIMWGLLLYFDQHPEHSDIMRYRMITTGMEDMYEYKNNKWAEY